MNQPTKSDRSPDSIPLVRRQRRVRKHEKKLLKQIPSHIEPAMEWGERWDDARTIATGGKKSSE